MTREGQRVGLVIAALLVLLATLRGSYLGFTAGAPAPTVGVVATGTSMPSATPTLPPPTSTPTPTITPTATLTPTVTPTGPKPYTDWARDQYGPPWEVNCDNEAPEDGYIAGAWALDFCVPGFITRDAYWYSSPNDFYGLMSSYAPGVMEAQLRHRGIPEGSYKDGVALMSCNEIGDVVWLRRPGFGWDGPFIVVDCSAKNHMYYHMVGMGLAVEVGFKTTERWGAKVLQRVDVHIGSGPPGAWSGVYLPQWWVHYALKWEGAKPTPYPTLDPQLGDDSQ